jgi:hypothetical protein
MRYNAKSWKNENVSLRVTKKSEKDADKELDYPTSRVKERSIKVTIG